LVKVPLSGPFAGTGPGTRSTVRAGTQVTLPLPKQHGIPYASFSDSIARAPW